ncbi:hypothetical protein [Rudanella lutea]|uniref:hypothetical protein n=1 Tax=Rudanella lutea TaxID=451374 RepID=UPI00037D0BF2|nr:hypothetical protein [Rudanella lutea]
MHNLSLLLATILFVCLGCTPFTEREKYKNEEFTAIESVVNEYLKIYRLPELLDQTNYPGLPPLPKPSIDTIDAKVYLSDALMPLAQTKEDDESTYQPDKANSFDVVYKTLMASSTFSELGYREFEKKAITLQKPFRQIYRPNKDIKEEEQYSEIKLSRVCFNDNLNCGMLYLWFGQGSNYATTSHTTLVLIEKKKDKWIIVDETYNRGRK